MARYTQKQKAIAEKIDSETTLNMWRDYKWQLKHAIKDIDTFQTLTGIMFSKKERKKLEKTVEKFPLSITPYYLSLIDTNDYQTDPIFKQAFPDAHELIISKNEEIKMNIFFNNIKIP